MLVSELVQKFERLGKTQVLFVTSKLIGKSREHLIAHLDEPFSKDHEDELVEKLNRIMQDEPRAYVLGEAEFYGRTFRVDRNVLIPRPETELLIDEVIALSRSLPVSQIVDVGTGSGCIAVTLALELTTQDVIGLDISNGALKVAEVNGKRLKAPVRFFESNLLSTYTSSQSFGIVANLPYIAHNQLSDLDVSVVNFEPHTALFGGPNGTELIERLLIDCANLQLRPRWISLECGYDQKESVSFIAKKNFGECTVLWKNDLAGIPRICTLLL